MFSGSVLRMSPHRVMYRMRAIMGKKCSDNDKSLQDPAQQGLAVRAGDLHSAHLVVQPLTVRQHLHVVGGVAEELTVPGLLKEHRVYLPHAALQICPAHLGRRFRGPAAPLLFHRLGDLGHLCRRRAGADGIGEDMHLGKTAGGDEAERLGKLLLCLLREAADQVCGNSRPVKILV